MKRVCIVCEGQTEEMFVSNILAPAFYGLGLNLIPQMIETSPGHRSGALSYDRVKRHLRNTLRQKSSPTVTTFFDLYRLDKRFPGFDEAHQETLLAHKVGILCNALLTDIIAAAECLPTRFIPHIQPHEFEGLLFSDVATLVSIEKSWATAQVSLSRIRAEAETPEHINGQPETHPAAHLARELKAPKFSKLDHGPIAAAKMGLPKIEAECKFFLRLASIDCETCQTVDPMFSVQPTTLETLMKQLIMMVFLGLGFIASAQAETCPDLLNFTAQKLRSKETVDFCKAYQGKVILAVNTASQCGFTPQFKGLEALYQKYQGRNFVILGFPSDDFHQEFKEEEKTSEVCYQNYGVTFPMFKASPVRGDDANAFFKQLAVQSGTAPKWNFYKYLIDAKGHVVESYASPTTPEDPALNQKIEALLNQP